MSLDRRSISRPGLGVVCPFSLGGTMSAGGPALVVLAAASWPVLPRSTWSASAAGRASAAMPLE